MKRRIMIAVPAAGVLALMVSGPVFGQKPPLAMLDQLEKGRWEMRIRDKAGEVEQLCLNSARSFIQLRHPRAICERMTISDDINAVTVQYTCHGQGYGRTSIRRESNGLIQIDSQGIAGGLPFAFIAEARRVGDCAG